MCDFGGKKNQTHEDAFTYLREANQSIKDAGSRGFGLFVVPAPELGVLESKTVPVDNLSYAETVKREKTALCFNGCRTD